ncbi:Uncharacterized protein SCF082_LOCUS28928, partial [Durusdinium trenchii]
MTMTEKLSASRKSWLQVGMRGAFLKGTGGPGAPHVFSFQRASDLCNEGHNLDVVDSQFWRRRQLASDHPDNVILRTKQYISDPHYKDHWLLYMPACVAAAMAASQPEGVPVANSSCPSSLQSFRPFRFKDEEKAMSIHAPEEVFAQKSRRASGPLPTLDRDPTL